GLNSISRGFTAAGAGGVISSLWNVNDETAITLMQHFYEQLATQPDISLALHNAKNDWLQADQENASLHLPYYWAGFIYSGHLQKVTVPAGQPSRSYYWVAAFLALPVIWYIIRKKKA
ncbi:MAG TPA: CHAT domain-containing protein, partial [Niastella sp.]